MRTLTITQISAALELLTEDQNRRLLEVIDGVQGANHWMRTVSQFLLQELGEERIAGAEAALYATRFHCSPRRAQMARWN